MSTQTSEQIEKVKRWFLDRRPELVDLDLDMELIENRILDSLAFVNFILFLENLTGREFSPSEMSEANFRTLRSIGDRLLGGA